MFSIIQIITIFILVVYTIILYHITGKNRGAEKLIWAFGVIAILGFVFHVYLFTFSVGDNQFQFNNLLTIILFSLQYSLEMFIANTIIFKTSIIPIFKAHPILFSMYLPIYGMALLTSGFAVFHFLSRRLYNWFWLSHNSKKSLNIKTHIFIGINTQSQYLANDILKHINKNKENINKEQIIFIDIPDKLDNPQGISIWDIISRFFKESKENEDLSNFIILKADKSLKKLTPWLKNKNNIVYILSDNQNANISILVKLWEYNEFNCKIYCHAKKEGIILRYDNITDVKDRIKFIDSSYLAVEYMKKHNTGELLPVNYVDIAKDTTNKKNLGYVTSSFNCAVIGFGETGKEAMKFLYEYGAFPDKHNSKVPFLCHIFDSNIDKEVGELGIDLKSLRSTESKNNEFELHSCRIDSYNFNSIISNLISDLNYIVISLGNDTLNLETALNIAEFAKIQNRDISKNFCIAVKQSHINNLNKITISNANEIYNNCIHIFGMNELIWRKNIINQDNFTKDARKFFESYTTLTKELDKINNYGIPDTWDKREKKIISNDYEERCTARRHRAQDFSNSLHKNTKRILCAQEDFDSLTFYKELASKIFDINIGSEHSEKDANELLEHLAVCEHLRWEASHLMLGYKPTSNKTDEMKKLHKNLKPYRELDEVTKHYDWLVVKNSIS